MPCNMSVNGKWKSQSLAGCGVPRSSGGSADAIMSRTLAKSSDWELSCTSSAEIAGWQTSCTPSRVGNNDVSLPEGMMAPVPKTVIGTMPTPAR
eukprot:1837755-Amphidinium_carterae.1